MVKILGILDLIVAIILLSIAFNIEVPIVILIIFPLFLFFKACISLLDIGGIIDMSIIILIVLSFFISLPFWIFLIGAFAIGLKGIMSLFAQG